MVTLSLRKDGGGWRHYAGERPIYCGTIIEALICGEWICGRYEADLSDGNERPKAYLLFPGDAICDLYENTEVRFPAKRD